MRLGPAPRKKEKQVVAAVSNCHEEKPATPERGKNKLFRGARKRPHIKTSRQVAAMPAPSAAPRRQDAAGNKVVDWRQQSRLPPLRRQFPPHLSPSKCERSRAGKSQPELPSKNPTATLHFRFTKPKKCGTLERDLQRNYKEEWSVTNWAF